MQLSEKDLERVFEATRAITSTLRLSELLGTVMKLAGEVSRAEASALLLLDPATGELYFDVALGEKGGALQQIRLKKGEGIAGWVAENRKPAVVNDVAKDPRWTQRADEKSTFKTRAILALPMLVRDKLIGVMEVINRTDGEPFNDVDLETMGAFAGQAAVAIENARLFESIRQEKEKMATILAEMSEGTLLLDAEGRITLANPTAERFLGQNDLKGVHWRNFEKTFEIKPTWDEVKRSLGGAGGMELARKDPPVFQLSGVINQTCSDRGEVQGYLIIFRDVTEERREAMLKRNFLSLVSHKLKTPLVAIRGFTPLLLEKPEELTSFQKTAIDTIDRNSQQLASLVEKLVWFSTLENDTLELTPKPQSIASVVDAALTDLASYLKTQPVELERQTSLNTLPLVPLDKIWLQQALRNLIENAVKFNTKDKRKVWIGGKVNAGRVEIFISDDGIGIPPEEKAKIFQKFYQIEASFTGQVQGMGLGLALVKRVAEAHGGDVRVESSLGSGSTFTLSLPIKTV
jgi:signal transduction histidine kinase